MNTLDLLAEFIRLTGSTNINRGRDSHTLKVYMEESAMTAIEVLWQMYHYPQQNMPAMIPSFIRWMRNRPQLTLTLDAELGVIEKVTGLKPPMDTLAYFDYADGGVMNSNEQREMDLARDRLIKFINGVLAEPLPQAKMRQ